MHSEFDESAFRSFERSRHDDLARSYHDFFAPVTAMAITPLLNAVQARAGARLLDIACGPGALAGAAAELGAAVHGVDLAPNMVVLARSMHPGAEFREADVEALPYEDDYFDCVVCNFGLGHFPDAERALTECVRVLRPGGRLAVSWWDVPARQRIQGLLVDALDEIGVTAPSSVPEGPPVFRYSEESALLELLGKAGFVALTIERHGGVHEVDSIDTLWRGSMGSLARTSAVVMAQSPEIQERIRAAYDRLAASYATGPGLETPISFIVAGGKLPT